MTKTACSLYSTRCSSSKSVAPVALQNFLPIKKSRLPCCINKATPLSVSCLKAFCISTPVGQLSSSPIQASNKSPRTNNASAETACCSRKCKNAQVTSGRSGDKWRSEINRIAINSLNYRAA